MTSRGAGTALLLVTACLLVVLAGACLAMGRTVLGVLDLLAAATLVVIARVRPGDR